MLEKLKSSITKSLGSIRSRGMPSVQVAGARAGSMKGKKLIVVIGPESTGTRVFTELLSQHPQVIGTPNAQEHVDIMDQVWNALARGDRAAAVSAFPEAGGHEALITRRSMPHASSVDTAAKYMRFPDIEAFHELSEEFELSMRVVITTRSPAANLSSWALSRGSARRSLRKAKRQYVASYRHLFDFLNATEVPFFVVSLEALVLDGKPLVQSMFELLGLPPHEVAVSSRANVNADRYKWFSAQKHKEIV